MASLPVLVSLADDLDRLSVFSRPFYVEPVLNHYHWPAWNQLARLNKELGPASPIGKDGFQVCLDVGQFKPSELSVKVVDDCVLVEGQHEEREDDYGLIARHFVRRYALPKGFDPDKVMSTLSSNGVLTVSVPKPRSEDKVKERLVQIQQIGPAHPNVKANTAEPDPDKKDKYQEENNPKK